MLPVIQLNRLYVSPLTHACKRCDDRPLQLQLRRVPEGASPMQRRIPQVVNVCHKAWNFAVFCRLFYQQHPVDARHADVSGIGRDQHLQVINLNVFNIHHRLNGTHNEREVGTWYLLAMNSNLLGSLQDTAGNYRGFLTFGGKVFIGAILVAYHHFARW